MRKASHEALNKVVAHGLNEYQIEEAVVLARNALQNMDGWDKLIRDATTSLMLRSVYDESPVSDNRTEWLHLVIRAVIGIDRARCSR